MTEPDTRTEGQRQSDALFEELKRGYVREIVNGQVWWTRPKGIR